MEGGGSAGWLAAEVIVDVGSDSSSDVDERRAGRDGAMGTEEGAGGEHSLIYRQREEDGRSRQREAADTEIF